MNFDEINIIYWEHYWEIWSESAHGKYQGHLRMAIAKKHHRIKRFHWIMYILQEVCERILQADFSTH